MQYFSSKYYLKIVLVSLVALFVNITPSAFAQSDANMQTPFEKSHSLQTATVAECNAFYKALSIQFPDKIKLEEGDVNCVRLMNAINRLQNITYKDSIFTIFINNGIHPGEPDGIDACMMLVRDICLNKIKIKDNIQLVIIPIYNVTGALRRSSFSRINQNGPVEYGFRANGQNLDLNRDFIKEDAAETKLLKQYFFGKNANAATPDIFIDTHVSNGADYQHVLTLLPTQHNQLGGLLGQYQHDTLVPALYKAMRTKGYDLCPYVNHFAETPDSGWVEFFDSPRFSSGFVSLFHTIAILPETHMLKPFQQRVDATYHFLISTIDFCNQNNKVIKKARNTDIASFSKTSILPIQWKADSTKYQWIPFKGFQSGHKPSMVSGLQRLYYDKTKPFERNIKFYDSYKTVKEIELPDYYILPPVTHYPSLLPKLESCGCTQVNGSMQPSIYIAADTTMEVIKYTIENFNTVTKPYESHYLHYNTQVKSEIKKMFIPKGSILINTHTPCAKFLANVLEPTAPDSYFNWNFFDGILQQKEGYSDYVFEDIAAQYLQDHPEIKQQLELAKSSDNKLASSADAQLDWVYKHSPYYETTVNEYPIFKFYIKK